MVNINDKLCNSASICVVLAYFCIVRKGSRFNHMMPRGKKKVNYDQFSDLEDEDSDEYTYDTEAPSLPRKY